VRAEGGGQVVLDVANRHPARVEADDHVIEPAQAALALGDQARGERPGPIPRDLQLDGPELGLHRLRRGPGAGVGVLRRLAGALLVAQVAGQLGLQASLERCLDQRGHEPAVTGQLDLASVDLLEQGIQLSGGLQLLDQILARGPIVMLLLLVRHGHDCSVPLGTAYTDHLTRPLALILAIVLNNVIRGRLSTFFRTVFFLPVMAAASVIGVVLTFVLSPSNGPVALFLEGTGISDAQVEFLSDPAIALWSALLLHTWKNFGMTLIYWLAALQTVPAEYYEAAEVDGAGAVQRLMKVTLPILLPFAVIIVVLTANENLHAFALIQALTGGGPYYSSEVVEVYIFRTAFAPDSAGGVPRLGYASAAGCFFGVATLVIALLQAWAMKLVADQRARLAR